MNTKAMRITGADDIFGAFISTSQKKEEQSLRGIQEIELSRIYRPHQHRKYFDPEEIEKLKTAILDHDFRGAILVSVLPSDHQARQEGFEYELVYGATRYLAMEQLSRPTIPAEVGTFSPKEIRAMRLNENLIRRALNPLEEAEGLIEVMADLCNVSPAEVERDLNAANNAASRKNHLGEEIEARLTIYQQLLDKYQKGSLSSLRSRLLKYRSLPYDITTAIKEGTIDASKGLEIGSIKEPAIRHEFLSWLITDNPSVADIRAEKKRRLGEEKKSQKGAASQRITKKWGQLLEAGILTDPKRLAQVEALFDELLRHTK